MLPSMVPPMIGPVLPVLSYERLDDAIAHGKQSVLTGEFRAQT